MLAAGKTPDLAGAGHELGFQAEGVHVRPGRVGEMREHDQVAKLSAPARPR